MRKRDAAKAARLRAGETHADEVVDLTGCAAEDRALMAVRALDERLRVEGHEPALDDLDAAILDEACALGGGTISIIGIDGTLANVSKIAAAVGVAKSTVSRRIRRLIDEAYALRRFATVLLEGAKPLTDPHEWESFKAIARARALGDDGYDQLASMFAAGARARQLLLSPTGLKVERRGGRVIITGPGPRPPILRKAVRAGKAERVYDPPRCHACGRFLRRSPTKPRKFCPGERCRSRYRRRA